MNKASFLEGSLCISQLEGRLSRNSYLSQESLPSGADGQVFLIIERQKKIPDRMTHPNLYHWFIILKQFSIQTIQLWIKIWKDQGNQDQLVTAFERQSTQKGYQTSSYPLIKTHQVLRQLEEDDQNVQKQVSRRNAQKRKTAHNFVQLTENTNLSHKQLSSVNSKDSNSYRAPLNLIMNKNQINQPCIQSEYIMDMQLNPESELSRCQLMERLSEENLEMVCLQSQGILSFRIIFRSDKGLPQKLKDKISKWPEVSNLRFRRQKRQIRFEYKSQKHLASPSRLPL